MCRFSQNCRPSASAPEQSPADVRFTASGQLTGLRKAEKPVGDVRTGRRFSVTDCGVRITKPAL